MRAAGEQFQEYLGDAVYVSFDGFHIWLRTSNGVEITNEIALEPAVYAALLSWRERTMETFRCRQKGEDGPEYEREPPIEDEIPF